MATTTLVHTNSVNAVNWNDITESRTNNNRYTTATNTNSEIQVVLNDLPSNASEITSIQVTIEDMAAISKTSITGDLKVIIRDEGANYYQQTFSYSNSLADFVGDVHTTSNGSAKWTIPQVNGLNLHLDITSGSAIGSGLIIDFLGLKVIYTEAPTSDEPLKLSQGFVKLTSGKVVI